MQEDHQLIDFNNTDKYSVRTLKSICEKNNIKIPLWPDKTQLISAISDHQKYLKLKDSEEIVNRKPQKQNQNPNSQFNTPILPMSMKNSSDNTFPTPIVSSKRVDSQLPDKKQTLYTPIPHKSPSVNSVSAEERYLRLQNMKEKRNSRNFQLLVLAIVFVCFAIVIYLIMSS